MLSLLLNKWTWIALLASFTILAGKLYISARDDLAAAEERHKSELAKSAKELAQAKQDEADAIEWAKAVDSDSRRANKAAADIADMADKLRAETKSAKKRLAELESKDADLANCLSRVLPNGLPKARDDHSNQDGQGILATPGSANPPMPQP